MNLQQVKVLRTISKIVLLLTGLFLLGYIGYVVYMGVRYKPYKVRVTNVTDSAFTVSWITDSPMTGIVYYGEKDTFLPGPLAWIGKKKAVDDRDTSNAMSECVSKFNKKAAKTKDANFTVDVSGFNCNDVKVWKYGKYYTHHITVQNLDAEKVYFFRVGDGVVSYGRNHGTYVEGELKGVEMFAQKTLPVITKVESPNPAYGVVQNAYKDSFGMINLKTNFDSIVFLNVKDEDNVSGTLSSVANSDGGWTIDLGNVRNIKDSSPINLDNAILEFVPQAEHYPAYLYQSYKYSEIKYPLYIPGNKEEDWENEEVRKKLFSNILGKFSRNSYAATCYGYDTYSETCIPYTYDNKCPDWTYSSEGACCNAKGWCKSGAVDTQNTQSTPSVIICWKQENCSTDFIQDKMISCPEGYGLKQYKCEPTKAEAQTEESCCVYNGETNKCVEASCNGDTVSYDICERFYVSQRTDNGSCSYKRFVGYVSGSCQPGDCYAKYYNDCVGELWGYEKAPHYDSCRVAACGDIGHRMNLDDEGKNNYCLINGLWVSKKERKEEFVSNDSNKCLDISSDNQVTNTECWILNSVNECVEESNKDVCSDPHVSKCSSSEGGTGQSYKLCYQRCSEIKIKDTGKCSDYKSTEEKPFYCSHTSFITMTDENGNLIPPNKYNMQHGIYGGCQFEINGSTYYQISRFEFSVGSEDTCYGYGEYQTCYSTKQNCTYKDENGEEVLDDNGEPIVGTPAPDLLKNEARAFIYCFDDKYEALKSYSYAINDTKPSCPDSHPNEVNGKKSRHTTLEGKTIGCSRDSRPIYNSAIPLISPRLDKCATYEGDLSSDAGSSQNFNNPVNKLVKQVSAEEKTDTSNIIYFPSSGVYEFETIGGDIGYTYMSKDDNLLVYIDRDGKEGYQSPADVRNPKDNEDLVVSASAVIMSTPTQKTTSKEFTLKRGINIISFNFIPSVGTNQQKMSSVDFLNLTNRSGDNISRISYFSAGQWNGGTSYDFKTKTTKGTPFDLVFGKGYVVVAERDTMIEIPGYEIKESVPVAFSRGWNLVGIHGYSTAYTARTLIESINTIEGLKSDNVTWWPTSRGMYQGYQLINGQSYGQDYPISPLNGYFVRISEFNPKDPSCKTLWWNPGGNYNGQCDK